MILQAEFPEKLEFLFSPYRYKVAYGGRGSGKSWGFARALLILAKAKKTRVLCAREVQKSIKQSVHTLLADQIKSLGLESDYTILETEIRGSNGSLFTFSGLAQHTVDSIKSIEGVDICWVEEGQTVSKKSWDILIPTIRKPGSEIWISFNPHTMHDDTYQRFVINTPPDSYVAKVNYTDNPWFPDTLEAERVHMQATDPTSYDNVWEGNVKVVADGAVWGQELQELETSGRLTSVPHDPALSVTTVWDLGVSDSTSIWFIQQIGREVRVIDYYEANGEGLPHYAQVLNSKPYTYGKHYAPHDIQVRELGSGRSRVETAQALGIKFEVVPNIPIEDGIHAARMLFPRCWFDRQKTKRGWDCLTNYRREYNDKLGEFKPTPVHDWASHGSDAWRYVAVSLQDAKPKTDTVNKHIHRGGGGWMR